MNSISQQAIREKLEYMRNRADHLARSAARHGAAACLDAYMISASFPISNANLTMTSYPDRD